MNKQIGYFLVFASVLFFNYSGSQESVINDNFQTSADVFSEQHLFSIKMSYSQKDIRKKTDDSTYIDSSVDYQLNDGSWQSLPVKLRRRGNNRLKNCYFAPLNVKLKKSDTKNTLFEGHKNLKIVLPCFLEKENNDNVVKEYLAYKLFEIVSPYHFQTRLLNIDFEEERGENSKSHNLKGILIEDDKNVAKRLDGRIYERDMHPGNQETVSSIRNALFQYMIGNTDFSQAYQHNIKVMYINKAMVPIPYDFDMSGFVNTSYAAASIHVSSVTERKYRGFARDKKIFEQVRQEFLANKQKLLSVLDDNVSYFDDPQEFNTAKNYILSFFDVIVNVRLFKDEILDQARKN